MYSHGINNLIRLAVEKKASDIHLVFDKPPIYRIYGDLIPQEQFSDLTAQDLEDVLFGMLSEQQKAIFMAEKELDFAYLVPDEGIQTRANLYLEKGHLAATIRILGREIEQFMVDSLPPIVHRLTNKRKGLVIVSGTAGSGKTTTLTYMIDRINKDRKCKIVTIEDPIEFIHQSQQSLIVQREVGVDTDSFTKALKYSLRQDPDVLVIGEIRDYESISIALTTAETGHLVFTTVHAADVVETLNRIIDVYPAGSRDQLCMQLSGNLLAIISQSLVPRADENGRILATEVLTGTTSIRNLIRRGAFNELRGQLDREDDEDVHTMEMSLVELIRKGKITYETAKDFTRYEENLQDIERRSFGTALNVLKGGKQVIQPTAKIEKKDQRVIVIDQNGDDALKMGDVVRAEGYPNVLYRESGEDFLKEVEDLCPHIIIMDMTSSPFSKKSHLEVCKIIKKQFGSKVTIIMTTNNLKVDTVKEVQDAGADNLVIKTKQFELLLKALRKLD